MNKVNTIMLCEADYASKEKWEDAIKQEILVIVNARCIMTAKLVEEGIFQINFNPSELRYGCDYPYWLSSEEYNRVYNKGGVE